MAGKGADDRCRDCGSLVALHFDAEGAPLGCPYTPSRLLAAQRGLQRVRILVWNLTTDEQEIRPLRAWQPTTRRPSPDEQERAIEQLRHAIGPVALVRSVSGGQGTGSAARSGCTVQTGGKRKRIPPESEEDKG
jgi:hypothetical protein